MSEPANTVIPSEEVGNDSHTAPCRVTGCSGILKDRKRSDAAEATAAADAARRTRERCRTQTGITWWPRDRKEVAMKSVSSAYADVNGIKLYHEIYGAGYQGGVRQRKRRTTATSTGAVQWR